MKIINLQESHISLAHRRWQNHLRFGDTVIDATVGNGHDALFLAKLVLAPGRGRLLGFDIQKKALERTQKRLEEALDPSLLTQITLFHQSHEELPRCPARLICYNLGYLPGGDKEITTKRESTLKSLQKALDLLEKGGLISITFYSGHNEGAREEEFIMGWVNDNIKFEFYKRLDRRAAPSLLFITPN
jgi:SAM-dependent methyltransferase